MATAKIETVLEAAVKLDQLRRTANNAQLAADIALGELRQAQEAERDALRELEQAIAQANVLMAPSPFEGIAGGAQAILEKPREVPPIYYRCETAGCEEFKLIGGRLCVLHWREERGEGPQALSHQVVANDVGPDPPKKD